MKLVLVIGHHKFGFTSLQDLLPRNSVALVGAAFLLFFAKEAISKLNSSRPRFC